MKYLLDTHTALWLFQGNEKLPQLTQDIIYNADIDIYVSIVSAWEVAIKVSLDKLDFSGGVEVFISAIEANNIKLTGIQGDYVKMVETLPLIHRDPFDRLIIATAVSEGMTIITIDDNIQKYDVPWLW